MRKKYGYMSVLGTGCVNTWKKEKELPQVPLLENDSGAASIME